MNALSAAALLIAAGWAAPAAAETSAPSDAAVIAVRAIDAVAVAVKTDLAARTLTIKDPQGRLVTIDVPPEVPLDRIRDGALLDLRYVDAEALSIVKSGDVPRVMVRSVAVAPKPGRPAGLSAKPRRVEGRIRDIDRLRRELTIVGPDDKPIALNVAPVVEGFDGLKAGDAAAIEYTGPMVLSAVPHDGDSPGSPRL